MYKVITHTIREEHFTHPETAKFVLKGQAQDIVDPFTTTAAMQYRDNAKSISNQWINSLRSYVTSTDAGEEGFLRDEITRQSQDFAFSLFGDYMPQLLFADVNKAFQDYCQALVNSISAVKSKQDPVGAREKAQTAAQDIAKALSRVNRFWPQGALEDLFGGVATEFANQAEYRLAKQYSADMLSTEAVERLMFSGGENGSQPLIDVVTKGMILLFSSRFK